MLFVGIFGEYQKLVTKYFHQKALNSIATFTVHTQLINLFLLEKLSLENINFFAKTSEVFFFTDKASVFCKKGNGDDITKKVLYFLPVQSPLI